MECKLRLSGLFPSRAISKVIEQLHWYLFQNDEAHEGRLWEDLKRKKKEEPREDPYFQDKRFSRLTAREVQQNRQRESAQRSREEENRSSEDE